MDGLTLYNDSVWRQDEALAIPGPSSPGDVAGPESLPTFGSHDNVVRNNTVLLDNPERMALPVMNGCYGNRIRNNILINGRGDSIQVTSASMWRHDSGWNVVNTNRYVVHNQRGWGRPDKLPPIPEGAKALAGALDETNHTAMGVALDAVGREFVRDGREPWIVVEGNRWSLNPVRPDFRPRAASSLLAGKGDPSELPPTDLTGRPRHKPDIGAFASE